MDTVLLMLGLQNVFKRLSLHGSVNIVLKFLPGIPDPPYEFIVDQNQTTSSTLFVAWQPWIADGFQQNISLEFITRVFELFLL